ncbi:MAG: site-2 protease family protein [Thermoleophilia bacterium]|nr:site-2 protease family protein [Thermoleophilia bacterium]
MDLDLFLLLAPCVLVSLALHELAHAWVAWKLGDPTARGEGRITLNPLRHLDPLGTLMFAVTSLVGGMPFGWAKPVPVNPGYFRRPKQGMAVVAAAGPATNFALALASLALVVHGGLDGRALDLADLAYRVNVVLGIFNLIPIPPLDGSRIVGAVMDDTTYRHWIRLDHYGMIVVLGLFFVFHGPFTDLLVSAFDGVTRVMGTIVGA